jgi:hypothetical protein
LTALNCIVPLPNVFCSLTRSVITLCLSPKFYRPWILYLERKWALRQVRNPRENGIMGSDL